MTGSYAKVIKDSVTPLGQRLTTFEVCFRRFVLAEFNTHRVLSKNSASSRAIPVGKQVKRLMEHPAMPEVWPEEQKGMQGGRALDPDDAAEASEVWLDARDEAVSHVAQLLELNVHKSVVNRLVEPFMWHTVVVTGTAWENFFKQRCSPLAQPEIRVAAEAMFQARERSSPTTLQEGQWHLPYLDDEDDFTQTSNADMARISAARCARVSYLTHDGKRDLSADLDLFAKLVDAQPPHWSPLEHVATPDSLNITSAHQHTFYSALEQKWMDYPLTHLPVVGNLLGWRSLRVEVEAERGIKTFV